MMHILMKTWIAGLLVFIACPASTHSAPFEYRLLGRDVAPAPSLNARAAWKRNRVHVRALDGSILPSGGGNFVQETPDSGSGYGRRRGRRAIVRGHH